MGMVVHIRSVAATLAVLPFWLTLSSVSLAADDTDTLLNQAEITELCSLTRALKKDLIFAHPADVKLMKNKLLSLKTIPDVVCCSDGKRNFRQKGYTGFAMASDGSAAMLEISKQLFGQSHYFIKRDGRWQFVTAELTWEY